METIKLDRIPLPGAKSRERSLGELMRRNASQSEFQMKTTTQADQFRDPVEAAIYVRVSNREQSRSGVSEEARSNWLKPMLRSRNLRGSHVFREEGVSASTPLASRPAGTQLLKLVKAAW